MAITVYRYRFDHVDIAKLAKVVPNSPTLSASAPSYVDISVDSAAKSDLDEAMAKLGFAFLSTSPSDTPTAALSTALGATTFDPRRILWKDHFVTGNPGTTDKFGSAGWRTQVNGTGPDITIDPGEAGRPGIARMEAGTTAAARAAIYLGDSTLANNIHATGTQNQIDYGWVVRPGGSLLAVNLERLQLGLGSEWSLDAELLNGIYWRYTPVGDTFWTLVTANGGTRTTSVSTVTPTVGTWNHLAVRITYPGGVPTVQGFIDGASAGTAITTNLPAASVSPGLLIQSQGSIVLEAFVDIDEAYGYQDHA